MDGDDDLVARLENTLPATIPVGCATTLFVYGTCFDRSRQVAGLEILVGERGHRPAAFGMPRPETFHALPPEWRTHAFRSGFWGTVPFPAVERPGTVEVGLAVRYAGGARVHVPLGRVRVVDGGAVPAGPAADGQGLIAVCMATFEPDPALFAAQVESLRAQTDDNWVCVVSDDCSRPEHYDRIVAEIGDDPRFTVTRAPERLRFYRNFERALLMAPAETELFALCDQDDRWRPDKLAALRAALGDAELAYSDQRLVDADGSVRRESMWQGRANNSTDITSMLVANSITGASMLFGRDVARAAVPFPDTPGMQFHDHWLAMVALALGDLAYVDRPLYDYVQHDGAIFGKVSRGAEARSRPSLKDRLRGGRSAYFLGYLPRQAQALTLLERLGDRIPRAKRTHLRRFTRVPRSPFALAWLALRPARALAGRNETLGSELEIARGVLWRWFVGLASRGATVPGWRPIDARYPDPVSFEQRRLRRWRENL